MIFNASNSFPLITYKKLGTEAKNTIKVGTKCIALVCATQGYETRGGAKDVGISTTKAAVLSTIYMLVADFIINIIFYL